MQCFAAGKPPVIVIYSDDTLSHKRGLSLEETFI